MELTPRKQKLLSMIVERYVATGEPVGSKFLSAMFGTAISSATIRNEMAALSLEGLIEQPYTSAGRVPTPKGYRYFIDHLRPDMELSVQEKFRVDRVLAGQSGEPDSFLDACCSLLSDMTGCTALASTPSGGGAVVTGVQLVKTGTLSVMILLRNSLGVLKSRVILLGSEPDMDDIRLFYSIAANLFIGKQPEKLSKADVQTMAFSLEDRALTMSPLLSALYDLALESEEPKAVVRGRTNILRYNETAELAPLFLELFDDSARVCSLLGRNDGGVRVYIGRELRAAALEDAGAITYGYRIGGRVAGSLGLIGPMRMDYARYIPVISYLGERAGEILGANALAAGTGGQ